MDLKQQLEEKRKELHLLLAEVMELEKRVLEETWQDKSECSWTFNGVSEGMCPYGQTIRGQIYCKNINCHK